MSHASGQVWKDGKIIAHYEYNGTSDVPISCLHPGPCAGDDWIFPGDPPCKWRGHEWRQCKCGRPSIDVLLYTNYGYGYHWPGKVCLDCKAITDGFNMDSLSCGEPMCDEYGCDHWPKRGTPDGSIDESTT